MKVLSLSYILVATASFLEAYCGICECPEVQITSKMAEISNVLDQRFYWNSWLFWKMPQKCCRILSLASWSIWKLICYVSGIIRWLQRHFWMHIWEPGGTWRSTINRWRTEKSLVPNFENFCHSGDIMNVRVPPGSQICIQKWRCSHQMLPET